MSKKIERKEPKTMRPCLSGIKNHLFPSSGPHNRICFECQKKLGGRRLSNAFNTVQTTLIFLVALVLASPAAAQDFTPGVTGEGVKTVVVVAKLPFVVTAPPGAGYYAWFVPQGVVYTRKTGSIEVTAAPKGDLTISVDAVTAALGPDGKAVVFTVKTGSVTVSIGDSPGPPKPPDPPAPVGKVAWAFVVGTEKLPADSPLISAATWNGLGVMWHHYASANVPTGIASHAVGVNYPALVLCGAVDSTGTVPFLRAVPLPATVEEIRKELAK